MIYNSPRNWRSFQYMGVAAITLLISGAVPVRAAILYQNFFNPVTGHYYALTLTTEPFLDARAEAADTGNHLATVNDAAENDWIYNTFGSTAHNDNARLWIGFTDELVEGMFVWDNGEPVTFTKWDPASNEPTGGGGENYTEMITTGGAVSQSFWNDNGNGAPNYGVIESDHPIPEPTTLAVAAFGLMGIAFSRRRR